VIKPLKNYFIPNQNNDYRPHIFKKREVVKIVAGILLLEAIFLAQVFLIMPRAQFFASVLPGVLVNLANGDRQSSNLNLLTANPLLERAAQLKANDMLAKGYFSHVAPDGKTPWYWLNSAGYKYSAAGENLAINFVDSKDINNAWMNSPSHRANILNNKFTEIGIATATGVYRGRETTFVVQFFGKLARNASHSEAGGPARNVVSAPSQPTIASVKPTTVIPAQPINQPVKPIVSGVASTPASVKAEAIETPIESVIPQQGDEAAVNSTPVSSPPEEMFVVVEDVPVTGDLSQEKSVVDPPAAAPQNDFISSFKTVLTSPRVIINLIFIILGGIVFLALLLKLLSRTGIQYAAPIFNGLLILVILISLFYFNHYLLIARAQIF